MLTECFGVGTGSQNRLNNETETGKQELLGIENSFRIFDYERKKICVTKHLWIYLSKCLQPTKWILY
jgi:hypothetical protein